MRATSILILLGGVVLAGTDERPVADLLADLADPHPNIRAYCADVLGTFTDERIHPRLVSMATEEEWPGPSDRRSSRWAVRGGPMPTPS